MTGENIICLARDWHETPTSNNHVMLELARNNRVLWLNSISTRTPSLQSGRDIRKIFRKLAEFLQGANQVGERIWVYTPLVLPFPHSPIARRLNAFIVRIAVAVLRRKLGMREFQLWSFLPNVSDFIGKLGESVSVYYCVDEWSGFSNIDTDRMVDAESELCRKVDIIFAPAHTLAERKRELNPETHVAPHGVDHALFAKALHEDLAVPEDIAALPGPVIGFFGTLQDWVDQELICFLAARHPDWSFVLIGREAVDISRLKEMKNVYCLGQRAHSELPAYCKGFDVGIIPYLLTDRLMYVSPLKRYEFLAAGLPVVSTAVPEIVNHADNCSVARTYNEFDASVQEALRNAGPEERRRRSESVRSATWENRVADLSAHVMRIKSKQCQKQNRIASDLSAPDISASTTPPL